MGNWSVKSDKVSRRQRKVNYYNARMGSNGMGEAGEETRREDVVNRRERCDCVFVFLNRKRRYSFLMR